MPTYIKLSPAGVCDEVYYYSTTGTPTSDHDNVTQLLSALAKRVGVLEKEGRSAEGSKEHEAQEEIYCLLLG